MATTDGASTVAKEGQIQNRSRDVSWYNKDLTQVPDSIAEVFKNYSKIPPEKVNDHIYALREKAWDIWPFPCLGGWRFLNLILYALPQYPEIITRIQKGDKFLDLGCGLGQEVRRLIYDGAPSENLHASDLRPEFFDIGYDLFLDRDSCKASFIASDAFSESSDLLKLEGSISIIYTGAFFHLFDRPEQLYLAKLVARLLKPEAGSMLLGRQVGSTKPGLYEHQTNEKGGMFRHDGTTWRELWDEVSKETGTKWSVESDLRDSFKTNDWRQRKLGDDYVRELYFCVRRL